MPPKTRRRLLTALHGLLVFAIVTGSLTALEIYTQNKYSASVQPIARAAAAEPSPVIPIPEAIDPYKPNTRPQPVPREGMFGDGTVSEKATNVEPLGETAPPLVPVALRVEADGYVLQQGEKTTVRVLLGEGYQNFAGKAASSWRDGDPTGLLVNDEIVRFLQTST